MAGNWWENMPVVQAAVVSEGKKGQSSAEAKTAQESAGAASQAMGVLQSMGRIIALNKHVPAGRWATRVQNFEQNLPSNWQSKDVVPFQMMDAEARGSIMPVATVLSGKALGSSQINSDRELEFWKGIVPNSSYEAPVVQNQADNVARRAMQMMARQAFMQAWRGKLGSTETPNAKGQTSEAAFADYIARPDIPANIPLSGTLARRAAERKRAAAQSAMPSDVDSILSKYGVR